MIVLGLMAPVPGSERTVTGLVPIFGLDPALGDGARAAGPLSAVWYIVFIVPFFLWTPDAKRQASASNTVIRGLKDLKDTLASLPSRGSFLAYLASLDVLPRCARRALHIRRHLRGGRSGMGHVRARRVRGGRPRRRRGWSLDRWPGRRAVRTETRDCRHHPRVDDLLLHHHHNRPGRSSVHRRRHRRGAIEPADRCVLRLRCGHRGGGRAAPSGVANHARAAGRRGANEPRRSGSTRSPAR